MSKSILIVASHPDDETFGCGGTILKHIDEGDQVSLITLTNGVSARDSSDIKELNTRKENAQKALSTLGVDWVEKGDFPDNSMDSVPLLSIIQFIEKTKKQIKPEIIYTHSLSDLNIDHRITTMSVITAFRPEPKEVYSEIRLFEVPSSTDYSVSQLSGNFQPNLYVDIEKYWKGKLKAMQLYKDELKPYPHSRSLKKIETLAEFRGAESGLVKAEAFEVVRKIHR